MKKTLTKKLIEGALIATVATTLTSCSTIKKAWEYEPRGPETNIERMNRLYQEDVDMRGGEDIYILQ